MVPSFSTMATEALISIVLEDLTSIIACEVEQEIRLVVGVEKKVETLRSKLLDVKAVLDDAEKRQLKEEGVKRWMCKLKNISYDMNDVLDEWSTAIAKSQIKGDENGPLIKKVLLLLFTCSSCFRCGEVGLRHDIAIKIKDLNKRFDVILNELPLFNFSFQREISTPVERFMTTSLIDVEEVKGREEEKGVLIEKLLAECSQMPKLHVISIVGMGGIGKTTLASLVYNDDQVKTHFQKRMWVCVSDPFDEIRIAKAILESLAKSSSNFFELESILQEIQLHLGGKKFLLVLDDVWEENSAKWVQLKRCLKCGLAGSKILVTTRKEIAATAIGCDENYPIGELSERSCWLLFSQIAFSRWSKGERQQFEEIGRNMVSKCKGLPLAVKTMGSLLHSKRSRNEWQSILDSWVWELRIAEVDIFHHLWLSYYDLSPPLRQCFSYCAIFSKDHDIVKYRLIESWMAHGYLRETPGKDMESLGEEYFLNLASRSFFQEFRNDLTGRIYKCKMHDIVHDFALYITKNEYFSMEVGACEELGSFDKEARHSRILLLGEDASIPNSFYDLKKLRGLIIQSKNCSALLEQLPNLFNQLTYLRSLDISDCNVEEISSTVSQLIHLRELILSNNKQLKLLPETLCDLYNLQTLDVKNCESLEKLPDGMGKLHNLKNLHNHGVKIVLPKGVGRLSGLRALDKVKVGPNDDGAFCLGDLEKLNKLQGHLSIEGLGNVMDVSGAKQSSLNKKSQVTKLWLHFEAVEEENQGEWRVGNDEDLIQVLEPPPSLEVLVVNFYHGAAFSPKWLLLSLINLKYLALFSFVNCQRLPPLGKLPYLETLYLTDFPKVEMLGVELLGIDTELDDHKTATSAIAFPKLTTLEFENFQNWEEWDDDGDYWMKSNGVNFTIMPCLCNFTIMNCPKLKQLPGFLLQKFTPQTLQIWGCPILMDPYYNLLEGDGI